MTGGSPGVALRAPSHPVARALLAALGPGDAIVAPSANRYQSLSPTRAEHVVASLAGSRPPHPRRGAVPERHRVDRRRRSRRAPRAPSGRALDPSAPRGRAFVAICTASRPPRSPSARRRDKTRGTTRRGRRSCSRAIARPRSARAAELTERGERVCVVLFGESLRHDERDPHAPIHVLPATPDAAGSALYALLYELDRQKYAFILAEPPPDAPGWEAIADRLKRASIAR